MSGWAGAQNVPRSPVIMPPFYANIHLLYNVHIQYTLIAIHKKKICSSRVHVLL